MDGIVNKLLMLAWHTVQDFNTFHKFRDCCWCFRPHI